MAPQTVYDELDSLVSGLDPHGFHWVSCQPDMIEEEDGWDEFHREADGRLPKLVLKLPNQVICRYVQLSSEPEEQNYAFRTEERVAIPEIPDVVGRYLTSMQNYMEKGGFIPSCF